MGKSRINSLHDLVKRLPKGGDFRADAFLAAEFDSYADDESLPDEVRDLCIDLALRAAAIETGPLGIKDADEILEELARRIERPAST